MITSAVPFVAALNRPSMSYAVIARRNDSLLRRSPLGCLTPITTVTMASRDGAERNRHGADANGMRVSGNSPARAASSAGGFAALALASSGSVNRS